MNSMINTKHPAPGQMAMLLAGLASTAYYYNRPYPQYAFGPTQWPVERGPVPTALPLVSALLDEGSAFTFRNGSPTFTVIDDPAATDLLREIIVANSLDAQWISMATQAQIHGAIACKWSIDMEADCPIRLTFLSVPQECRVWCDPHDMTKILLCRIAYPFRSLETGEWHYFREEWTSEEYVTYKPLYAGDASIADPLNLPGYMDSLGDAGNWEIDQQEPNPFGVIPITIIRNSVVKGMPLGAGTANNILRIVDRICLTLHLEDFANQSATLPTLAFINAESQNMGALSPGEPISVLTSEGSAGSADVKLLQPDGAARAFTHLDLDRWTAMLYKAVGLSLVDPQAVSSKGSLSEQVLRLLYQTTISTSDMRRELWGNSGMAVLFRNLLIGLSRVVADRRLTNLASKPVISVVWPDYFTPTDSDLADVTSRTVTQMDADLLSHEAGIERVGQAENLDADQIAAMKTVLLQQKKDKAMRALPEIAAGDSIVESDTVSNAVGANNFTG
jgi:hypothetical protein